MKKSEQIAYCAMLTALSMIFSYIEALLPLSIGIPGVKLGLSNLVVVTGLSFLPVGWVFLVLVLKVTLVSFLFGNFSIWIYSMAGGMLSFFVMLAVKRRKGFSLVGVSIAGGVYGEEPCTALLSAGTNRCGCCGGGSDWHCIAEGAEAYCEMSEWRGKRSILTIIVDQWFHITYNYSVKSLKTCSGLHKYSTNCVK